MGVAKLPSASRTDQFAVAPFSSYPQPQCHGGLIDFVPKDSVAWPIQDFREFVVAHSPESSRTTTSRKPALLLGLYEFLLRAGKSREFFQIGVSGNKTGISVYILGLKDKKYLAKTYGKKLGKASVTGYCIRFKALKDINIDTLEAAIRYGLAAQNEKGKLTK